MNRTDGDIYGIHPPDPRFDITAPPDRAEYIYKLATNYLFFATELWKEMGWDQHHHLTRVEYDILHFAAYGPDRRGILAPRGLGKSHLVAVTLPLFRFLRDPQRKILEPSKSREEAKKNTGLIRNILNSVWFLRELAPGNNSIDTANMFELSCALPHRQPSMVAIGIEGHLQGNRAHTIIPDDVEIDENTATKEARDTLANKVNEFESILYTEPPADTRPSLYDPPEICYVGTYNHEESVYLKESRMGFTFHTWPILYPRADQKILNLSPMLRDDLESGRVKPGDLVFPHRFGYDHVAKKQAKGTRYFNMQHMLVYETDESDRHPLKLENIMVIDVDPLTSNIHYVWGRHNQSQGSTTIEEIRSLGLGSDAYRFPAFIDPERAPYTGTHVAIDPAGTGEDKVGFSAVASINGFLVVKKCLGLKGGYSEPNLVRLAELCREVRATEIFIERTMGGGMFDTLFQPILQRHFLEPYTNGGPDQSAAYPDGWKCSISTDSKITSWATYSQKETRIIDVLEPVFGSHRILFDTETAKNADLQFQITRITREKGCLDHYDEIDSLALAVKSWQYNLALDTDKAARRSRAKAFDDRIAQLNARAVHALDDGPHDNWAPKW